MSTETAKRVYLINWILTSPEPQNDTDIEITRFQQYGVDELDGIIYSRMGLAFERERDIEEWIKIVKAAQDRLNFEKENYKKTQNTDLLKHESEKFNHTQKTVEIALEKLLPKLKEQMDLKEITVKLLANKLQCSNGLISQSTIWQAFKGKRDSKQKTSSKTERLNDIYLDNTQADTQTPNETAMENEELKSLIAEQAAAMDNQNGPNRAFPDR